MSRSTKQHSRLSYAGRDPKLLKDTPAHLRAQSPAKGEFDQVRDPLYAAQLRDMKKTESQRREEQGRGSLMVKLHKPFPELRPKHEDAPLRSSFNRAWLREQRAAALAYLQAQREAVNTNELDDGQKPKPTIVPEWGQ